jgi:hypothetical protein
MICQRLHADTRPLPRWPGLAGLFFVLLAAMTPFSHCNSAQNLIELWDRDSWITYEPEHVHWFHKYGFIEASPATIHRLKQKFSSDFPDVLQSEYRGSASIYRIHLADSSFFQRQGFAIRRSGPFRWIDPGISTRKQYNSLQEWMRGYKDEELALRIMRSLSRMNPGLARVVRIGTSVQNRPIYGLRIENRSSRSHLYSKPTLLFNGGHHGMEVLSVEYAIDLACQLLGPCWPHQPMDTELRDQILNETVIWIVPVVNPDGLHRFWNENGYLGRKNANGVDLNRNYPFFWDSGNVLASSERRASFKYRGTEAASEPETKAMMDLARRERFLLSFSFHTYATRILFPYTADGAANPYPNPAQDLAQRFARKGTSYRTTRQYEAARKLYSVDGTDQDWLFHELGTMAFIVEGSMSTPSWQDGKLSIEGMRPVSLEALRATMEGPRIAIRIEDENGLPLKGARLELQSRTFYHREKWPGSDELGTIHLFLSPREILYATIQQEGYQPLSVRLKCSGLCKERFQLTPIR